MMLVTGAMMGDAEVFMIGAGSGGGRYGIGAGRIGELGGRAGLSRAVVSLRVAIYRSL